MYVHICHGIYADVRNWFSPSTKNSWGLTQVVRLTQQALYIFFPSLCLSFICKVISIAGGEMGQ